MDKPAFDRVEAGWRIFTWIGISAQLMESRAERLLGAIDLPLPQYVMLNHFSHRPDEAKTITGIASALQQPQPGVTKTVQKLVRRGYLKATPSREDKRSTLLTLTPAGKKAHGKAVQFLTPSFEDAFAEWSEEDFRVFVLHLDRLKQWLDTKGRE